MPRSHGIFGTSFFNKPASTPSAGAGASEVSYSNGSNGSNGIASNGIAITSSVPAPSSSSSSLGSAGRQSDLSSSRSPPPAPPSSSSVTAPKSTSPSTLLSHRRSFSRSSQLDLNQLRRSISLRSDRHRQQPVSSHQQKQSRESILFGHRSPSSSRRQESKTDASPGERLHFRQISGALARAASHHVKAPSTQHPTAMPYGQNNGGLGPPAPLVSSGSMGSQNPQMTYQHILDTASKRISTLDYLRKAHEGRVYWFNTLLFSKPDLLKMPFFTPHKLARRASNYLLLGFSLPTILDLNSQTATEYLRALNALLVEFEQYQSMHPPDGSGTSSLSRARIPQMFKRATGGGNKARRQTDASIINHSASDLGLSSATNGVASSAIGSGVSSGSGTTGSAVGGGGSNSNAASMMNGGAVSSVGTGMSSSTGSMTVAAEPLLPTEQYQHLLTPPLPFDPDFFETFATLCDVLIDCYSRVTQLISSSEACIPGVGELFAKADARVRKIIVAGVVREFEERSREGMKGEISGVGKLVLGGLM